MKKLIISLSMTALLTAPVFVFANQATDQLIQQLQAQLSEIQNQLNVLLHQQQTFVAPEPAGQNESPQPSAQVLPLFLRNLSFGLRNDSDVSNLQEFLAEQGYYSGPVSGNFFLLTFDAVKKFQAANGIIVSGYFGPLTRARANEILKELLSAGAGSAAPSETSAAPASPATSAGTPEQPASSQPAVSSGAGAQVQPSPSAVSSVQKCAASFSPNSVKVGDITTWNFAAGAGDTAFQYSCSAGITKEDGTALLSYGTLPLSGSWRIKVSGPLDCTLTSWNPNVTGSGSTCRAMLSATFFIITTTSLPNGSVNAPYNFTLATTDIGTAPYQWSWSPVPGGILPAGLSLNSSTGVISGTPTAAGKYGIMIKAMDTAGNAPTKTFTFYVDAQAGVSTQCTTSFSPNPARVGDITTWNFAAGAGDTAFQYSCSAGITKEDGTALLSYGTLPLSGSWRIKVSGPLDCTLDSYNPNVVGSGSQCRAILKGTVAESTERNFASALDAFRFQLDLIAAKIKAMALQ